MQRVEDEIVFLWNQHRRHEQDASGSCFEKTFTSCSRLGEVVEIVQLVLPHLFFAEIALEAGEDQIGRKLVGIDVSELLEHHDSGRSTKVDDWSSECVPSAGRVQAAGSIKARSVSLAIQPPQDHQIGMPNSIWRSSC